MKYALFLACIISVVANNTPGTLLGEFTVNCDNLGNVMFSKGENPCNIWGRTDCRNYELTLPSMNETIRYTYCSSAESIQFNTIFILSLLCFGTLWFILN